MFMFMHELKNHHRRQRRWGYRGYVPGNIWPARDAISLVPGRPSAFRT